LGWGAKKKCSGTLKKKWKHVSLQINRERGNAGTVLAGQHLDANKEGESPSNLKTCAVNRTGICTKDDHRIRLRVEERGGRRQNEVSHQIRRAKKVTLGCRA